MRRALVFILGALGARDALGLVGPKPWARGAASSRASVVASTEMVRARPPKGLGIHWTPTLSVGQLLHKLHSVDGVQQYKPRRSCKSGGGLQTGHAGYLEWSAVNRFDRCLSCDLLEFTPRPHAGYFSDVNNQDAKLARDGDFAKAESIAFMDEAIDGELKLFSVADRE